MKRRFVYDRNLGEMVEVAQDYAPRPRTTSWQVMADIAPYQSMIDGREISSRSRHREHLRDHNCVEVGNDSSLTRKRQPLQSPPGLKEKLIRAVHEAQRRLK